MPLVELISDRSVKRSVLGFEYDQFSLEYPAKLNDSLVVFQQKT